jgi:hypothetical protein
MGLSFLPVKQSGRSDDMFRNATLAVVMGLAVSGMAAAQQVLTPEQAIPNQYIVVFDDVQVARTQVAEQRHAEQGHRGRHRLAESPPLLAVRRRIANRSSTDRRLHLRLYRADLHVRWQRIDGRCRDRHLQLDFGDGQVGSGAIVTHAYGAGGTFTVALTVIDTAKQPDTESKSITVTGIGAPCTNCTEYMGSLSGTGASQYQPNGTYYFSAASGIHRGWLQGPANPDFDLYLQKWNGFWWVTVAVSESVTSTEQIAYTGTIGYYRWRVYSYSGSGAYTFWLQLP